MTYIRTKNSTTFLDEQISAEALAHEHRYCLSILAGCVKQLQCLLLWHAAEGQGPCCPLAWLSADPVDRFYLVPQQQLEWLSGDAVGLRSASRAGPFLSSCNNRTAVVTIVIAILLFQKVYGKWDDRLWMRRVRHLLTKKDTGTHIYNVREITGENPAGGAMWFRKLCPLFPLADPAVGFQFGDLLIDGYDLSLTPDAIKV